MAERNPTVDFYKTPRYLATVAAVPRLFTDAFAGIDLLWFRVLRPELDLRTDKPYHIIVYAGPVDDLLRHGLLSQEMIPRGRKQLSCYGDPGEPSWETKRRAKGRIEVRVDHPPGPLQALNRFGPDRWPFFDSASAAREYCRSQLTLAADDVTCMTRVFAGGAEKVRLRPFGFRFHPDDQQRMQHLVAEFQGKLRAEIVNARIESLAGPTLRLVGDDPDSA